MNAHLQPTGSAYFIAKETSAIESHTLSVLVDNEPAFSPCHRPVLLVAATTSKAYGFRDGARGASVAHHHRDARHAGRARADQGAARAIVPVHRVLDLTVRARELGQERPIEREWVALVKVVSTGEMRAETLRLADAFHAKVVDATVDHFIFEITGKSSKIDQFVSIMKPLGLNEICRTGIAAMNRGPQGM